MELLVGWMEARHFPFSVGPCSISSSIHPTKTGTYVTQAKINDSLQLVSLTSTTPSHFRSKHLQNYHKMTRRLVATLCLLISTASAFTGNTQLSRPITSLPSPATTSWKLNTRRNDSQSIKRSRSSSQLQMSAVPIGAFAGILTGGIFAGGLHAIAGKFRHADRKPSPSWKDIRPRPDLHVEGGQWKIENHKSLNRISYLSPHLLNSITIQDPITWQLFFLGVVDNDGTRQERLVLCGVWVMEYRR